MAHRTAHESHPEPAPSGVAVPWSVAASATLHCLTGCAIGEVLGMVVGTAFRLPNAATVVLSVALAFVFGYGLTARGVLRAGVGFRTAVKIALAADTVSIAVMEVVDNAVVLGVPGAMDATATLHCLTGCAIGEVLGMVIGTATGMGNAATVVLSIALAFLFGYALTMRGVLASGVGLRQALKIALAADTVSIAVMEIVDNGVILAVPGAMDAGLADALFWGTLALSLAVAFVVTTPVNRWMISRGRGHAVVHAHHGH